MHPPLIFKSIYKYLLYYRINSMAVYKPLVNTYGWKNTEMMPLYVNLQLTRFIVLDDCQNWFCVLWIYIQSNWEKICGCAAPMLRGWHGLTQAFGSLYSSGMPQIIRTHPTSCSFQHPPKQVNCDWVSFPLKWTSNDQFPLRGEW